MTNFSALMNRVDATLDASAISDDVALPDGSIVRGRFLRYSDEIGGLDGVVGGGLSVTVIEFRCAATAAVLALIEGSILRHAGNDYHLNKKVPTGGDHVGRIVLELGTA